MLGKLWTSSKGKKVNIDPIIINVLLAIIHHQALFCIVLLLLTSQNWAKPFQHQMRKR